jgi:hypothetical protein
VTDLPLTCEYCRTAPASCLMVADFGYSRVKALVCQPCGERSRPDAARVAKAVWLFSLGAVFPPGEISDDEDALTDSQCFRVSEARDSLTRFDAGELLSAGIYGTERTLADHVRNLLAIVGQTPPATAGAAGEDDR